jgi:hypothetical protein
MRFLLALVVLLSFQSHPTMAFEPVQGLKGKRTIFHSTIELSKAQRLYARRFQRQRSFAALAVNTSDPSGEAIGAAWGYHSLKAAQRLALRSCEFKAKAGENCVLFLSVVPKNFDENSSDPTLSQEGMQYFLDVRKWSHRHPGRFRALAINGGSVIGDSGTREPTRQGAEAAALKRCAEIVDRMKSSMPRDWQQAVLNPADEKCRILIVFGPED